MQIRTHLSEAGLDPASISVMRESLEKAKKTLDEINNGLAKADKSGTIALNFLESLISTLSMVYGMVEQGPDAHAGSDYRLVVSAWKEQPAQRPRWASTRNSLPLFLMYHVCSTRLVHRSDLCTATHPDYVDRCPIERIHTSRPHMTIEPSYNREFSTMHDARDCVLKCVSVCGAGQGLCVKMPSVASLVCNCHCGA